MKAIMTSEVIVSEIFKSNYNLDIIDNKIVFAEGMEVEVLRIFTVDGSPYTHYVIYSDELKESTTVYEDLLKFID